MLASITPLGERGRRSNWRVTATMHVLGGVAGGAAVGTLAALLGMLVLGGVSLRLRAAALACVLAAGLVWELLNRPVPGPRRQVDERWLDTYRGWVYGLGYGTQLGAGLVTVITNTAVYAVPVAALLSARPAAGAVIGATAGAFRGLTVLATARVASPARLLAFHLRMRDIERPVRATVLLAQLALTVAAALAVVS
ncbi:MAG: hypothetical protein ACYC0H_02535 [Solirubrobacteraceae bacterium]